MELLEQIATWMWFMCFLLGMMFVLLGFAGATVLMLSREVAAAGRMALLVAAIGVVTTIFVGLGFGYRYQSPSGEVRVVVVTLLLASANLMLLSFGCFRAFKLFTSRPLKNSLPAPASGATI